MRMRWQAWCVRGNVNSTVFFLHCVGLFERIPKLQKSNFDLGGAACHTENHTSLANGQHFLRMHHISSPRMSHPYLICLMAHLALMLHYTFCLEGGKCRLSHVMHFRSKLGILSIPHQSLITFCATSHLKKKQYKNPTKFDLFVTLKLGTRSAQCDERVHIRRN